MKAERDAVNTNETKQLMWYWHHSRNTDIRQIMKVEKTESMQMKQKTDIIQTMIV